MSVLSLGQEIDYPTSDGHPMAENTLHRMVMTDLIEGLEYRYAQEPDVWVGGNLFLCYEEGNRAAIVAPDVLLAKGVRKELRQNYMFWEETPPSLVVEVTSKKTRRKDQGSKKSLYERLGVEELVLFDPYGEYLRPWASGLPARGRALPAHPPRGGWLAAEPDDGLVFEARERSATAGG